MTIAPGIKGITVGLRDGAGPSIAAGFVRGLLDLAVAKGAGRAALLERAGLTSADLEDQDARIPLAHYMALMRAGQVLANDPALALHFGEAFDMAELSIVGLIGQACETFGEAFAQLERYHRLVADIDVAGVAGAPRLILSHEGGKVWMIDTRANPNAFPELTESGFARMVCSAHRAGRSATISQLHVTHKAPPYRAEYDRVFRMPVVFESDRNALLMNVEARWLEEKIRAAPRYVFGIFSDKAEALLRSLENSRTVRGRVESQLMPILHKGDAGMDAVAARLGISRQRLYRELRAEGTTFEKVLDALRHKLALNYLSGKKVSVNETAYLVGFSDPAAFSRAFKRWTGTSPRRRSA